MVARIDAAAISVRRQLEVARAVEHDSVKTLCLNDKLSQLDVAYRSARDRRVDLAAAVQRSDVELSDHEFTILTVLRQRAEQLGAEAQQCIGAEVAFVGQTSVVPYVNPSLPADEGAHSSRRSVGGHRFTPVRFLHGDGTIAGLSVRFERAA